jgi:hemerythrin-like metal-binding protein
MLTGLQNIDDLHHAVMQLAFKLKHCHDYEVPDIYRTMLSVLEQTFGREQRIMEEFAFPAMQSHLEQHARVLAALHNLHPAVMDDELDSARRAGGELLPDWLHLHMATQDAALGVWVSCRQNSHQASVMEQLISTRNRQKRQLSQAYYAERMDLHFIRHPVHEHNQHEHGGPML